MSVKMLYYRMPKRSLWPVMDTVRSWLHADHEYAYIARLFALREHRAACAGETTDLFRPGVSERIRTIVTENGIEAMLFEFGPNYVFYLVGVTWWYGLPEEMVEYLAPYGLTELQVNTGTDAPSGGWPGMRYVDPIEERRKQSHYTMVPLLTPGQVWNIYIDMAIFLSRQYHKTHPQEHAKA